MKATYDPTKTAKFTTSHRREGKCHFESLAVVDLSATALKYGKRLHTPVELRLYGTGNLNYACLWIHLPSGPHNADIYTSGSGRAGGYGYHRPSAAAGEAIRNAGFTLWRNDENDKYPEDIGGVGDSAIVEALCAIAECLGIENYGIVRSHP